jgi:erythromycin esterase-like protein
VRFLHERHGFDTLIYEAPRVPCSQANRSLLSGTSADKALPACAWIFWSRTEQSVPLRTYLDDQRDVGTPLNIAGMDPQNFNGNGKALVSDLNAWLTENDHPSLSEKSSIIASRLATGDYQAEALRENFDNSAAALLIHQVAPREDERSDSLIHWQTEIAVVEWEQGVPVVRARTRTEAFTLEFSWDYDTGSDITLQRLSIGDDIDAISVQLTSSTGSDSFGTLTEETTLLAIQGHEFPPILTTLLRIRGEWVVL